MRIYTMLALLRHIYIVLSDSTEQGVNFGTLQKSRLNVQRNFSDLKAFQFRSGVFTNFEGRKRKDLHLTIPKFPAQFGDITTNLLKPGETIQINKTLDLKEGNTTEFEVIDAEQVITPETYVEFNSFNEVNNPDVPKLVNFSIPYPEGVPIMSNVSEQFADFQEDSKMVLHYVPQLLEKSINNKSSIDVKDSKENNTEFPILVINSFNSNDSTRMMNYSEVSELIIELQDVPALDIINVTQSIENVVNSNRSSGGIELPVDGTELTISLGINAFNASMEGMMRNSKVSDERVSELHEVPELDVHDITQSVANFIKNNRSSGENTMKSSIAGIDSSHESMKVIRKASERTRSEFGNNPKKYKSKYSRSSIFDKLKQQSQDRKKQNEVANKNKLTTSESASIGLVLSSLEFIDVTDYLPDGYEDKNKKNINGAGENGLYTYKKTARSYSGASPYLPGNLYLPASGSSRKGRDWCSDFCRLAGTLMVSKGLSWREELKHPVTREFKETANYIAGAVSKVFRNLYFGSNLDSCSVEEFLRYDGIKPGVLVDVSVQFIGLAFNITIEDVMELFTAELEDGRLLGNYELDIPNSYFFVASTGIDDNAVTYNKYGLHLPDWGWLLVIGLVILVFICVGFGLLLCIQSLKRRHEASVAKELLHPQLLETFRNESLFGKLEINYSSLRRSESLDRRMMWTLTRPNTSDTMRTSTMMSMGKGKLRRHPKRTGSLRRDKVEAGRSDNVDGRNEVKINHVRKDKAKLENIHNSSDDLWNKARLRENIVKDNKPSWGKGNNWNLQNREERKERTSELLMKKQGLGRERLGMYNPGFEADISDGNSSGSYENEKTGYESIIGLEEAKEKGLHWRGSSNDNDAISDGSSVHF